MPPPPPQLTTGDIVGLTLLGLFWIACIGSAVGVGIYRHLKERRKRKSEEVPVVKGTLVEPVEPVEPVATKATEALPLMAMSK